jgi:uncharacterized protein YuzB (UPF0349 family)
MAGLTSATLRLRFAVVLIVVISVAAATAIASGPAGAATSREPAIASQTRESVPLQSGGEYECLTNDSGVCLSQEIAIIVNGDIVTVTSAGIVAGAIYVYKKFISPLWNNPAPGKHEKGKDTQLWQGYLEYDGDAGGAAPNTSLCMAAAETFSVDVTWAPCGADGTVWIEEPDNNGGDFLFDRYSLDNGCSLAYPGQDSSGPCMVMSSVATNDTNVFVDYPNGPGGSFYQDWNP